MSSVWVVTHETSECCPVFRLVAARRTEAEAHAFVANVVARYDAVLAEFGPEPQGESDEDIEEWGDWWDLVRAAIESDPLIGLVRDERDGFSVREMTLSTTAQTLPELYPHDPLHLAVLVECETLAEPVLGGADLVAASSPVPDGIYALRYPESPRTQLCFVHDGWAESLGLQAGDPGYTNYEADALVTDGALFLSARRGST